MAAGLSEWANKRWARLREEAMQRTTDEAIRRQQDMGTEGIAEVPEGVRGQYAKGWEKAAAAAYGSALNRDAQVRARELALQHQDDPDGFAQAWNAWMAPQIEPLEQADMGTAAKVREGLDQLGLDVMFDLQDEQAARLQEDAAFEARQNFTEFKVGALDDLNRTGSETALFRYLEAADEVLTGLREGGYLTTSQYESRRSDFRNDAASEQAFGAFRQAVQRGDIAGAEAVIERTRRGLLFDDNDDGRAVAKQLTTRLKQMRDDAKERSGNLHQRAMRTVDNYIDIAERGGHVDFEAPELQEAFNTAMVHANNDSQVDAVDRARTDLAVSSVFAQHSGTMQPQELVGFRDHVAQSPEKFPRGRVGHFMDLVDKRLSAIEEARFKNDPMSLVDVPITASLEQRNEARARVARATGAPAVELVPYYDRDDVRAFRDEFNGALDRGDTAGAIAVMDQFNSVVGDSFAGQIGLAQQAGITEFSALASVNAIVGDENTTLLAERARQARSLSQQERLDSNPPRSHIAGMAEAASLGHPDISSQIETLLTDAWAGLAASMDETGSRNWAVFKNDLRKEFDRLTEPLTDTVELDNGAVIPRQLFAPGVSGGATRDVINEWLNDPKRFGITPGDENVVESLRPVPLPDGGVEWFSTMDPNARVMDPETGGPLVMDLETRIAPIRDAEADAEGFFDRMQTGLDRSSSWLSFQGYTRDVVVPSAAVTGANPDTLIALRMTFENTPQVDRAHRDSSTLLSAEALESLDQAEYKQAWNDYGLKKSGGRGAGFTFTPPSPMSSAEGAAVAAGILLDQFERKYGDEEQALAAYWAGESVVDAMGADWRDQINEATAQFISRVLHHKRRSGGD